MLSGWQNVSVTQCLGVKMSVHQNVKVSNVGVSKCLVFKMSGVKMSENPYQYLTVPFTTIQYLPETDSTKPYHKDKYLAAPAHLDPLPSEGQYWKQPQTQGQNKAQPYPTHLDSLNFLERRYCSPDKCVDILSFPLWEGGEIIAAGKQIKGVPSFTAALLPVH